MAGLSGRSGARSAEASTSRVEPGVDDRTRRPVQTLNLLDEHVLHEPVRFLHVRVVVALPDVADLLQRPISHHLAPLAESLEGVLGLPGHDDVVDESMEIALARSVGKL